MKRNPLTALAPTLATALLIGSLSGTAHAERFQLDPGHSFIDFSISHLGFSVLRGRFNELSGHFDYDAAKPDASTIRVEVKTASIDSNHAERDKHLRGEDFLDVKRYPKATFVTTRFTENGDKAVLKGDLTLHGVTRPITVDVDFIGAGNDPWGGYRRGYTGRTTIKRADFGMGYDLGPAAESMELIFTMEGVRQ